MHRMAGLEPPTSSEAIKAVLAGIRRSVGTAVTRKAPATAETIRAIVAEMPTDLRGLRDRAMLLLGFAGALRRSELVAFDVADLEETATSRRNSMILFLLEHRGEARMAMQMCGETCSS
jgi:hypothetical protein